jgi:outer membrane protein OmpA-like peptidoglycan-associated protein
MNHRTRNLAAGLGAVACGVAMAGCATESRIEALPPEAVSRAEAPPGLGPAEAARLAEEQLETVEVPVGGVVLASLPASEPTPTPLVAATPVSSLAIGRELVYTIDGVRFPIGVRSLAPRSREILDQVADRLALGDATYFLEIQGHADGSGPEFENERLAHQRAETVRSYLLSRSGLPPERTAVVSLGSTRPVADDRTQMGRALNRRVTVLVLR